MAITHSTAIRNTLADAVVDAIDAGSTNAAGKLQIATSTAFTTVLATLAFANPAFGAAASGTATANAITPDNNAAATGTAAAFRIVNRDDTEILRGTVGTSGSDINLSSTSITAGDTVTITSLTYSAAP